MTVEQTAPSWWRMGQLSLFEGAHLLFCQITKNTQQKLHHIFFKTETVQDFKTLDWFKAPWQIFLSQIDSDLMFLDFQNHLHFFSFCFPTLYFSVWGCPEGHFYWVFGHVSNSDSSNCASPQYSTSTLPSQYNIFPTHEIYSSFFCHLQLF